MSSLSHATIFVYQYFKTEKCELIYERYIISWIGRIKLFEHNFDILKILPTPPNTFCIMKKSSVISYEKIYHQKMKILQLHKFWITLMHKFSYYYPKLKPTEKSKYIVKNGCLVWNSENFHNINMKIKFFFNLLL